MEVKEWIDASIIVSKYPYVKIGLIRPTYLFKSLWWIKRKTDI